MKDLLAALPFVPAAIGEWLTAWNYDPVVDSTTHPGLGPRVGAADVARIGQAKQAFARIDREFGAGLVRPALVKYLNGSVAPLLRGRYDDRTVPPS
ncbi:hypothetical protein ABZU32_07480 [Sphaerisporangium sp. NPDC005288]|uniref:hypothetical protein n=1 Tax=Sphaerisporangium sp. NPDC005288 TaxID=3155114 RepID=UPI0033A3D1F0